jgi:uncharacterized membrane protein
MKDANESIHITQSPGVRPNRPISRRHVLVAGSAIAGMMSATGVGSATTDDTPPESTTPPKTCLLIVVVTGLEAEGPMADVDVTSGDETKTTDVSGTVVFEIGSGIHKVTAEKQRWETSTKTVEMNRQHQVMHLPMHIRKYNDLTVTVSDASLKTLIQGATVTVKGYGTVQTSDNGTAMVMIEHMLEPTNHDLTITADGYHSETRQVTVSDDKHFDVELVPK